MELMSAEWFSTILQYLNLKDIAKVDTAFCSCSIRLLWLNFIKSSGPVVEFANNRFVKKITDWLVVKNILPTELSFKYTGKLVSHKVIYDTTIFRLTQHRKLRISDECVDLTSVIPEKLFAYTAALFGN